MERVVLIGEHPYIIRQSECLEEYGQEYLDDYGVDIPISLAEDFKKAYNHFKKVKEKLVKIRNENI